MRMAVALEQAATATLRRVADSHGLAYDASTTRAELIERIADRLSDRAYLEEQLRGLPEEDRAILGSARASGGELRGLLIDREQPGAADALAERGWLFRVFAAEGPLRGEVFVVPDELLAVLPESAAFASPPAEELVPAERRLTDPA